MIDRNLFNQRYVRLKLVVYQVETGSRLSLYVFQVAFL